MAASTCKHDRLAQSPDRSGIAPSKCLPDLIEPVYITHGRSSSY
jgi:hypothetical protein